MSLSDKDATTLSRSTWRLIGKMPRDMWEVLRKG